MQDSVATLDKQLDTKTNELYTSKGQVEKLSNRLRGVNELLKTIVKTNQTLLDNLNK